MNSRFYYIRNCVLFLLPFIFISCEEEKPTTQPCLLEEIQFDQYNRLKFLTISGGIIYEIKQQYFDNNKFKTIESFSYRYYKDSIAVTRQSDVGNRLPYLWVIIKDDVPQKVVRYFSIEGVHLIYTIIYSDTEMIRINMDRITSSGDFLRVGYGNYFLNDNGNVERLQIFGMNPEKWEELILYSDQFFTYDNYKNPVRSFYLPFFDNIALPDPGFFNNNNIVSVSEGNSTYQFFHEYGVENQVLSSASSYGEVLNYSYLNCTN